VGAGLRRSRGNPAYRPPFWFYLSSYPPCRNDLLEDDIADTPGGLVY
jgi:hypothetical protein